MMQLTHFLDGFLGDPVIINVSVLCPHLHHRTWLGQVFLLHTHNQPHYNTWEFLYIHSSFLWEHSYKSQHQKCFFCTNIKGVSSTHRSFCEHTTTFLLHRNVSHTTTKIIQQLHNNQRAETNRNSNNFHADRNRKSISNIWNGQRNTTNHIDP